MRSDRTISARALRTLWLALLVCLALFVAGGLTGSVWLLGVAVLGMLAGVVTTAVVWRVP